VLPSLIRGSAALALLVHLGAAERFAVRYFYDHLDSSLELRDLVCPSTQKCIAAGALAKGNHVHGLAIVTSDGGKHWSEVPVDRAPLSLYFLNDSLGWMVTERELLRTTDGGRTWNRIRAPAGLGRVWFLDASRGFAVGTPKAAWQTVDAGRTWTKVAAADTPSTPPTDRVSYDLIAFAGDHGVILGASVPPGAFLRQPWDNPARLRSRRQNFTSLVLETHDRGVTWNASKTDLYGVPRQVRLDQTGGAIVLYEYPEGRDFTSEVCRFDVKTLKATIVFREKNRAVTDVLPLSDGEVFLAAVEPPGPMPQVPVPGKLKIMRSRSLETWLETGVDYRAIARSAFLAASSPAHVWVATDTGMILELVP
jgi:hypothetical protein